MKYLEPNPLRNTSTVRRIVGVLLLAHFVFLLAMAQYGALHKAVHPDAAKPSHHCAVTMLRSGQVETPGYPVVVVPAVTTLTTLVVVESSFVPSVDYSLPPSCGPPALLS